MQFYTDISHDNDKLNICIICANILELAVHVSVCSAGLIEDLKLLTVHVWYTYSPNYLQHIMANLKISYLYGDNMQC